MTDSRKQADRVSHVQAQSPAHEAFVSDLFSAKRNELSPLGQKQQIKYADGDVLTCSYDDHQKLYAAQRSNSKGEVRFKVTADDHTTLSFNKEAGELVSTSKTAQGKTVDHYYKDASIASVKFDEHNHYQLKTISKFEDKGYHQTAKYDYQYLNAQGKPASSNREIDDRRPVQVSMVDEKSKHRLYNFASSQDLTGQKVSDTKLFTVTAADLNKAAEIDARAVEAALKTHKAEELGSMLNPLSGAFERIHSSEEIQTYRKGLTNYFAKMNDFKNVAQTFADKSFDFPAGTEHKISKEQLLAVRDSNEPAKAIVASYLLDQLESDADPASDFK